MRRPTALIALALTASLVGGAAPSLAGGVSDEGTMVIDPESGPPGTEIAVSGEGCATKGSLDVDVRLFDTDGDEQDSDLVEPSTEGFGGEWEATLTVPADTTDFGDWTVDATCDFDEGFLLSSFGRSVRFGEGPLIDYDDRTFTVTQPAPTPTPTPAPTPGATAPAAVVAPPTFTG